MPYIILNGVTELGDPYNISYLWSNQSQHGYCLDQGLSQDFETGCLRLAIVKYLGVQNFKGDHNILIFQP